MAPEYVRRWTEVDKAWLAGLLDGEGWIGVTRTAAGVRLGRYRYRAGIVVSQTDEHLIEYLHALVGHAGRRFVVPHKPPNKPAYELRIGTKDDIVAILEAILPLLITKADQALDVLAFRQLMDNPEIDEHDRDLHAADLFEALREAKKAIPYGTPRPVGPEDDPADAAWLAALVDGEGHIGIERQKNSMGRTTHLLVLSIVNTDERLIRRIEEVARHGDVLVRAFNIPNRKPLWRWRATCDNAAKVLERIGPYLIRKKPHLPIARRFDRTVHRGDRRWSPVLEHELRIREECFEAFRQLNSNGKR